MRHRRRPGHDDRAVRTEAAPDAVPAECGHTDPDQTAVWLFTSGTTGDPKAAAPAPPPPRAPTCSPRSTSWRRTRPRHARERPAVPHRRHRDDPVQHLLRAPHRLHAAVRSEGVGAAGRAEDVTHAMVVPTMLGRILDALEAEGASLPTLRHCPTAAGACRCRWSSGRWILLPGVGFVNAYGLTETSSTVAVLGPDEHRRRSPATTRGPGPPRLGRPAAARRSSSRSATRWAALSPAGETGEIYVRGEQIAGEYHGRSALTADGWFPTNDGGHLDADGFLFVEGRSTTSSSAAARTCRRARSKTCSWNTRPSPRRPSRHPRRRVGRGGRRGRRARRRRHRDDGRAAGLGARAPAVVADARRSSRSASELPYNETGKLLRRVLRQELATSR